MEVRTRSLTSAVPCVAAARAPPPGRWSSRATSPPLSPAHRLRGRVQPGRRSRPRRSTDPGRHHDRRQHGDHHGDPRLRDWSGTATTTTTSNIGSSVLADFMFSEDPPRRAATLRSFGLEVDERCSTCSSCEPLPRRRARTTARFDLPGRAGNQSSGSTSTVPRPRACRD